MKAKSAVIAAVASVGIAGAAQADTLFVNMAGFSSNTGFPTAGSNVVVNIGAGSTVTNIAFTDYTVQAFGTSWTNEHAVGVASGLVPFGATYWESLVPGSGPAAGILGPVNANFSNPGLYASTEGFVTATGNLNVYVYEYSGAGTIGDDPAQNPDATVLSGGITITYTPIPTPGALALLGLAGLVGSRRRRT